MNNNNNIIMTTATSIKGRMHSFESFGTVDGPGIRFIVFFQGCLMRCLYCHNRDTWDLKAGKEITVDDLMQEIVSYKNFIMPNGGGVTASGGEASLQAEFVTEWFKACHKEGIHTCLDTNGYARNLDSTMKALVAESDLVMLDLKQLNDDIHKKLVGVPNKRVLEFAHYLQEVNKRTWIRYVVVPGWTDDEDSVRQLGEFTQNMQNVERIELLPYHSMGAYKWETVGDAYSLEDVEPPTRASLDHIQEKLSSYGHYVTFSK